MDKLTSFLNDAYDAHLSQKFEKRASYNEDMDFLEYVSLDAVTISDRVDSFLTVMWNYNQDQIVGFRLKGFRCIFNQIIKPLSKLKNEDFDPLVEALEKIFTKIGNDIFIDKNSDDYRVEAYKAALSLIKTDKIDLPPEFKQVA